MTAFTFRGTLSAVIASCGSTSTVLTLKSSLCVLSIIGITHFSPGSITSLNLPSLKRTSLWYSKTSLSPHSIIIKTNAAIAYSSAAIFVPPYFLTISSFKCNSFRNSGVHSCGLPSSGFVLALSLGNAITSLMSFSPHISATNLSNPIAIPPCGGTPYLKALNMKSNLFSASSYSSPMTCSTLAWVSFLLIRMLPPPSSTPFSTQSYAFALTSPGAVSSLSMSSSFGCVNMWCFACQLLISSFHSYIGKSIIQQNLYSSFIRFSFLPTASLTCPSAVAAFSHSSAANNSRSPSCAFVCVISCACMFAWKYLTMLPSRTFLPIAFIHASPGSLYNLAISISSSISVLVNLPAPFAFRQNTFPFLSAMLLNIPKSECFTVSVTSINSSPNLRSGLSLPYLFIASWYVILWNGIGTSTLMTFL